MTAPTLAPRPLFAFVPGDCAVAAQVDALREQVAARREPVPAGSRRLVRAEIKGVRTADGWRLDRFSHCTQTWDAGPASTFRATTLYWRHGHGPARWTELPDEPYLDGLAAVLDEDRRAPDHEVLRYVPLRRFTWRADGQVHKVKRGSRLADSHARVAAVAAATPGTDVRVPALRGTRSVPPSYSQDVVDGPSLADLASGADLDRLLAEAGEVHAAFGALPVRGLPSGPPDACVPDVGRATDWVGFLLPHLRDLLARAHRVLLAHVPRPDAAALATCHGDLVPSHLIGRPGRWSVIDLDLAHRGDRYRDLAMFLAGLPADVPALADGTASPSRLAAAEDAYLAGYAARRGVPVDPRRLAWHRAVAELHHLALMVSKDGVVPAAVDRSTGALERALGDVGSAR